MQQLQLFALLMLRVLSAAFAGRQLRLDYLGCFNDYVGSVRDLSGIPGITQMRVYTKEEFNQPFLNYTAMTPQVCSEICSYGGFLYMGLQSGIGCYCSNAYGSQGNGTGCTMPCVGNPAVMCGGFNLNAVYALAYLNTNYFVLSDRLIITAGSSYTQPLSTLLQVTYLPNCLILCDSNCQAVIFNKKLGLCYLLKYALVPFELSTTVAGDFYTRA